MQYSCIPCPGSPGRKPCPPLSKYDDHLILKARYASAVFYTVFYSLLHRNFYSLPASPRIQTTVSLMVCKALCDLLHTRTHTHAHTHTHTHSAPYLLRLLALPQCSKHGPESLHEQLAEPAPGLLAPSPWEAASQLPRHSLIGCQS